MKRGVIAWRTISVHWNSRSWNVSLAATIRQGPGIQNTCRGGGPGDMKIVDAPPSLDALYHNIYTFVYVLFRPVAINRALRPLPQPPREMTTAK